MDFEPQLIALPEVRRITGLSKSEIWRRVSDVEHYPDFPKPIRMGTRCTRWNLPEVRSYVAVRLAARGQQPESQHLAAA
jgi:predicted DNA-binding transcriptional regulator AlpA